MKADLINDKRILLVDDERTWLDTLSTALRLSGFKQVTACERPEDALRLLDQEHFDVALLDLYMPQMRGDELLKRMRERHPDVDVFMVTAINDVDQAVECMRLGAVNYVMKPAHTSQLVGMVAQTLSVRTLKEENSRLRNQLLHDELKHPENFSEIITNDRGMRLMFSYIEILADTREPVLITGETGVGKELVARAIHRCSGREGRFVAVNVAGLDDTAFSDTLFGHKRGAFTGASDDRKGLIEQASGGTLFLDEMGSLDPRSQTKLLRLLQEGEYLPLGVDIPRKANIRLVAATNRDLKALQEEGEFRKDLYYRLNTHHVHVPPLRERVGDIRNLADSFLQVAARQYGKDAATLPRGAYQLLQQYPFPGNVRELRALMMDAGARYAANEIPLSFFSVALGKAGEQTCAEPVGVDAAGVLGMLDKLPSLQEIQQELVREALRRTDGNQSAAAAILGISRQALHQRIKNSNA